ncbi:Protoheme IX farnesyltransferase, mitochondrial [Ascosphaera aggregata]|nr:Protoheme IX farnesyltransferase, mitochondrial [Ascosphaera aggregata]
MSRTRNRPLVRGLMSKRAASIFAIITGIAGVTALYNGTNPSVAGLGAFNLVLYSFIYTPLKKISVLNTWVGAVVGGIPPLMGWVAAAGQIATTGHDGWRDLVFGPDSPGGWLLAAILYAWQFPHFNALSWSIREEYKRAGSRMLAWTNPAMNGRVALRYSILMFPLCAGLWYVGVVNKGFLVIGTAINAWMAKEAYLFWKLQGAKASARGLFWASIWHLPILMVGCLATKTGVWEGIWARAMSLAGYDDGDDDEDEYIEEFIDEEEAVKLAAVQLAAHAR